MRDLTDDEVAAEVAKIEDEGSWPQWPWLPMKNIHRHDFDRSDANDGLGMLLSPSWRTQESVLSAYIAEFKPVQVLLINMLNLGQALEERRNIPHEDFDSIEAMVRAGWIGD
jgi:hypothetical protein